MSKLKSNGSPTPLVGFPSDKLPPIFKLRNFILDNMERKGDYFLGRVLTIIDASIADPEQRKGIKDLVKDAYYDREYYTSNIREVIIAFAEKYCRDQVPKNNNEYDAFLGKVGATGNTPDVPNWF